MSSMLPGRPDQYKAQSLLRTGCHPVYDRLDLTDARLTTSAMRGILQNDYNIPLPNINRHLEIRLSLAAAEPKSIAQAMNEMSVQDGAERDLAEQNGKPENIAEAMKEMSLMERAEKDVAQQREKEDAEEEKQWLERAILATLALDYLQQCRDQADPRDLSWTLTLENFEPNEFLEHIWICLNRGVNANGAERSFEGEPANARANGHWYVQRARQLIHDVLKLWGEGIPVRDITPFYEGRSMANHPYEYIWN